MVAKQTETQVPNWIKLLEDIAKQAKKSAGKEEPRPVSRSDRVVASSQRERA
jgi:hypothetical protein